MNPERMNKVVVLYGHPADAEAFERYYAEVHIPLTRKMQEVARFEFTKFDPGPDGARPAYYRMAEIYFSSAEQMNRSLNSPEGRATAKDLRHFATGGVTIQTGTFSE